MRYHGGKWLLGPWIIGLMPAHETYVEAFGGAASVLLQKPAAPAEIYNDLDSEVAGLFRVLRDRESAAELERALRLTPFSREEFAAAFARSDDSVESARRMIVRAQMGFDSASATRGHGGFRGNRGLDSVTGAKKKSTAVEWKKRVMEGMGPFTERLLGVFLENRPALEVIRKYDSATTLHLLDPPYMHETRQFGDSRSGSYQHEMSADDHEELLGAIRGLAGAVMLCGYDSELYRDMLPDWTVHEKVATASGKYGGVRRRELLWTNALADDERPQRSLFG